MRGSSRRELEQNGAVGVTESQSGEAGRRTQEQLEPRTATKARERGEEELEKSVGAKAAAVAATEAMVHGEHGDPHAEGQAMGCEKYKLDQLDPQAKNETRRQEGDELELLTAAGVGENGGRGGLLPFAGLECYTLQRQRHRRLAV